MKPSFLSAVELRRIAAFLVIALSLCLPASGQDPPQPRAPETPIHETAQIGDSIWLVLPGERFGPVGMFTSEEELRERGAESPWHTPAGVRVGTTLAELEEMKGDAILFSGFGWDYGGGAGWDEHEGTLGLHLSLDRASNRRLMEIEPVDPRAGELFGDRIVRSDHPIVRQLRIVVEEIGLGWGSPVDERLCR